MVEAGGAVRGAHCCGDLKRRESVWVRWRVSKGIVEILARVEESPLGPAVRRHSGLGFWGLGNLEAKVPKVRDPPREALEASRPRNAW